MTDCENVIQEQVRGLGDWVLVPRVPTDAMLRAAQSAWLNDPQRRTTTMWSAMLYAAPQQPAAVFRNDGNTEADFIAHEANACTACGGSGHKADQQPAAVVDEAAVWRVIAELRAYNPAADEHKGAHIHKVWAKELAAALAQQSAAVDDMVVERIAALLHEEATGEPWAVAGVEHPGPDRDYYRGLASKVAALAAYRKGGDV